MLNILVTGGARGLGRSLAESLVRDGHQVWITCRSDEAGTRTVEEIGRAVSGGKPVRYRLLDMASFGSVRDCAKSWDGPALDVLFNNAGLMTPDPVRRLTEDGHELVLQSNALGPYLFTRLMLPRVKRRIVFMSSQLHLPNSMGKPTNWDWKDPEMECNFNQLVAYKNSKLAANWTAFEIARRYPELRVHAVCPGFVPETASASAANGFQRFVMKYVMGLMPFARSRRFATARLNEYATSQQWDQKSGLFLVDGKEFECSPQSRNAEDARRFWDWAEKVVGGAS